MVRYWSEDLASSIMTRSKKALSTVCEARLSLGLVLLSIAIFSLLLLTPYLVNNPHFEVGFDTGVYERTMGIYHDANDWRARLPAYPSTADYDSEWMDKMEPGFFVHIGLAYSYSDIDVRDLFRWVLPMMISVFMVLIVYVIATR